MEFSYLQKYAYKVLMAGYSVLLTGGAGTGKTAVINKFVKDQRNRGRNVMVCAPTGIAALSISGVTLHYQFKASTSINVNRALNDEALDKLVNTDTLVIDEISMCRVDLFDYIMLYLFNANNIRKSRGLPKIQLVLCGDFLQLSPVMKESDKNILDSLYKRDIKQGFAFESEYWDTLNLKYIVLTEIMRQDNKEFTDVVNRLRTGDKGAIQYIIDNCSPIEIPDAINLYGKNNSAIEKNIEELNKLQSELYTHDALITGAAKITDTNADKTLPLKVGARVMTLVNKEDEEGNLIYGNGSLGTVVSINDDSITVELDDGIIENIGLYTWEVDEYYVDYDNNTSKIPKLQKREIGTVTQYPLKLAYAITIHKAQGQTYNCVNINPYTWDCGQLYVALSRVRDIKNLYLTNDIDYSYLITSLNVINFYNSIIAKSNKDLDTTVDLTAKKEIKYEDADLNKILNIIGNM